MSTYTKRHSVQDMIRRRVEKNRKIKQKQVEVLAPKQIIIDFLNEMNLKLRKADNNVQRYWTIEDVPSALLKKIKLIDRNVVSVNVHFTGEGTDDIAVDKVSVYWSSEYIAANNLDPELHVDVMTAFMEDIGF